MQDARTEPPVLPAGEDHQQQHESGGQTVKTERSAYDVRIEPLQGGAASAAPSPVLLDGLPPSSAASDDVDRTHLPSAGPSLPGNQIPSEDANKPRIPEQGTAVSGSSHTAPESPADTAVAVGNPYRRQSSRHAKPKGILKPAPPPQAKFSFRRDVLGYVVGETTPLHSLNPINAAFNFSNGFQANKAQSDPACEGGPDAKQVSQLSVAPGATIQQDGEHARTVRNDQSALPKPSTGLWRRLGGAVTAVAGSMPVPQTAVKTLNTITGSVRPSTISENTRSDPPTHADNATSSPRTSQPQHTLHPDTLNADFIKSVRFTMSSLSVVYPIDGPSPPGTEAVTRKRINREHVARQEHRDKRGGWTTLDLLELYEECCRTREEPGIAPLRTMLMSTSSLPKVIDLRDYQLTLGSAAVLSDILSIDFGLRKLILDNCGLDDSSIKPIIHALLVSGSLPSLSLANNRRIKSKGWRMVAYYVHRSSHLKYLDLSDNVIDKKVADYFGEAINHCTVNHPDLYGDRRSDASSQIKTLDDYRVESDNDEPDPFEHRQAPLLTSRISSTTGLTSLRLENCSLRNTVLESLANSVRTSGIKHISLRRNRINQMGAVALAVLIRDYELSQPGAPASSSSIQTTGKTGIGQTSSLTVGQIDNPNLIAGSFGKPYSSGPVSSPTTGSHSHTHHPRVHDHDNMSLRASTPEVTDHLSPSSPSSLALSDAEDNDTSFGPERNQGRVSVSAREASRYAEMRTRLQKQIETFPRVGSLLTLDIRGNDIKGGITYISQVLKRNRTLRVLNLSDNKIDSGGLAALSEALKYNTTLETLDLSGNPCCGPSLDGLRAMRMALVLNSSLMRVFLNDTGFESAGAIALAEFLPDMPSVIHLDLTDNPDLNIAGVMALAAAIKHNQTLRCLDLSIPPNNADFARLSQDILQSCVRNTELAQGKSAARGSKSGIATPIFKSELARELKEYEKQSIAASTIELPSSLRALADSARHHVNILTSALPHDEELAKIGEPAVSKYTVQGVRDQALAVQLQMSEISGTMAFGPHRQAIDALNTHLAILLQRASNLYGFDTKTGPRLHLLATDASGEALLSPYSPIRSPASPNQQVSSPSFSITDSDGSEGNSSMEDEVDFFSRGDNLSVDQSRTAAEVAHSPERTPRPPPLELSSPTSPTSTPRSPVESHSRTLTLEEGEVFRRGISKIGDDDERTLLDVLDAQSEIAGEELKQEILDTEVERSRRSSISLESVEADDKPI